MFIYFIPGHDSNKCIMAYFTFWLSSGTQKFKLLICVYTNIPFAFEKLNCLELPRRVFAWLKKFQGSDFCLPFLLHFKLEAKIPCSFWNKLIIGLRPCCKSWLTCYQCYLVYRRNLQLSVGLEFFPCPKFCQGILKRARALFFPPKLEPTVWYWIALNAYWSLSSVCLE